MSETEFVITEIVGMAVGWGIGVFCIWLGLNKGK